MRGLLLLSVSIAAFASLAQAQTNHKTIGHMHSLTSEELKSPINLTDCMGVKIIEWRPLPSSSSKAIEVINKTCAMAVAKFHEFLIKENRDISSKEKFIWNVIIIPFDNGYRNMNDNDFRFFIREKIYRNDGTILLIPGYTQHQLKDIFIVNEIINSDGTVNNRFVTIFAHEMFHALSWHNGVYQSHLGDKSQKDELLAVKFTQYLNLGK